MVLIMIKQFQQRHACVLCKIEKKKGKQKSERGTILNTNKKKQKSQGNVS